MATSLTTDAEIHYNGINFSVYAELESIDVKPRWDSAERMLMWTEYDIRIKDHAFALDPTSADPDDSSVRVAIEAIRRQLMQPAGELVINGIGLGEVFELNTTQADVKYGPMPLYCRFKPTGFKAAWEVSWGIKCHLAECDDRFLSVGESRGLLEFNYKVQWALDRSRYTRRTTSVNIRVAAVRRAVDDFRLPDHADRFREAATPTIPFDCYRQSDDWGLSEDKTVLTGNIVDVQFEPNIPPPGVVAVSAEHTVDSKGPALVQWNNSLSATYEMGRHRSRAEAYLHFCQLVAQRMTSAREHRRNPVGVRLARGIRAGVIPTGLRLAEPIYGKESARFTATWYFVTTPETAVRASGLWLEPVTRDGRVSTWDRWRVSMQQIAGCRGYLGQRLDPNADVLVNLCTDTRELRLSTPEPRNLRTPGAGGSSGGDGGSSPDRTLRTLFETIPPPESRSSWLEYRLRVRLEVTDETAELKLLPDRLPRYAPARSAAAGGDEGSRGFRLPYEGRVAGVSGGNQTGDTSIIQTRAAPTVYVVLEGHALRAGFDIAPPMLESFAGADVVPANRHNMEYFATETASALNVPVVMAKWRLRWLLPRVPEGLVVAPDNALYGTPSGAQQEPGSISRA